MFRQLVSNFKSSRYVLAFSLYFVISNCIALIKELIALFAPTLLSTIFMLRDRDTIYEETPVAIHNAARTSYDDRLLSRISKTGLDPGWILRMSCSTSS